MFQDAYNNRRIPNKFYKYKMQTKSFAICLFMLCITLIYRGVWVGPIVRGGHFWGSPE